MNTDKQNLLRLVVKMSQIIIYGCINNMASISRYLLYLREIIIYMFYLSSKLSEAFGMDFPVTPLSHSQNSGFNPFNQVLEQDVVFGFCIL